MIIRIVCYVYKEPGIEAVLLPGYGSHTSPKIQAMQLQLRKIHISQRYNDIQSATGTEHCLLFF